MTTQNPHNNWQVVKIFLQVAPVIYAANLCITEANRMSDFPTSRLSLWATGFSLIAAAGWWFTRSIKKLLHDRTEQLTQQYQQSKSATQGVQLGFLQTISDDVRGPLMSIVTNLRSMSEHSRGKSESDELGGLYKQGIRLQSRLNSALELGRVNLERSGQARPIDLSQLASDIAENYAQALLNKPNLLLNILVDHRLPQAVEAEPHRLMLLMGNMLENAICYSEQGQINLKITSTMPKAQKGDQIELEISCSDCGVGIPADRLERLTAELEHAPLASAQSEAGLGLRAAMNIARHYKGTIAVSSKEGKGTTVSATLKLPVLSEAREWKQLPKSFRFCSSTQDTYIALGNAGFFHGVSMVPVQDPTAFDDSETILIDGSDLILKTWGPLDQFKPRERYVIMLHKDQHRLREQFLNEGFSRFLSWPLVSTMLLKYLTDEDAPITARKQSVKTPQVESTTILVVDDAETNRLRICFHLRSAGYRVIEATDGLEVVAMIKSGSTFDLILTDLNMTHLNGDEALKQIRSIESTKGIHTPIVAISAYVDSDAETNLKNAGFDAVLRKPVYLDELDFLLSSMIPEKKTTIKQTKLIDLEELKQRSNGKTRLMAILLDSFIQSSQSQLQDLQRGGPGTADKTTYLKTIHTLKGLLLEAGAKESAGYLNHVEKQARYTGVISMDEIEQITQVINNVSEEAAALRAGLEQAGGDVGAR